MTPIVGPETFAGRVLILAPHMDDESLGCGLLLGSRPDKESLHVAFVTDGSRAPERAGGSSPDIRRALATARKKEACEALEVLGVPASNIAFLGLQDGSLNRTGPRLEKVLISHIRALAPVYVFVPFRYDRHPDHVAVNRVVCAAVQGGEIEVGVVEYFVYSRWRLLPRGDVRKYLPQGQTRQLVPVKAGALALKRKALECYRSQTTLFYDWQTRPLLTRELVDRVCAEPELFLIYDSSRHGRHGLADARHWIPIAHRAEPVIKRWKDRLSGWRGT